MNYMDMCIVCTYYKGNKVNGVCRRYPPRTPVEADDQCGEFVAARKSFTTDRRDTEAPFAGLIDEMLRVDDDPRDKVPYSD